jgi:hypothetical protein
MTARTVTITGFVVLGALMLALYAAGRARRAGLAPLGDLLDAARAARGRRLTLVVVWAWLGWHFLAR